MICYGTLILRFDGAYREKSRESGSGWVLIDGSTNAVLATGMWYIGKHGTNDAAGYKGLVGGLRFIQDNKIRVGKKLHVQGDSKLVINHMRGVYRVESTRLLSLWGLCQDIVDEFNFNVDFQHISREKNKQADSLANEAIDSKNRFAGWCY